MAFRFRLAQVHRLRKRIEDERALALAQARRSGAALAGRLARLRSDAVSAGGALVTASTRGTSGAELRRLADVVAACRHAAATAVEELALAQARLEAARRRLEAAARDRRVLERLSELQRDVHRRRLEARSQAELDEIGSRRAGRGEPGPR